MQIVWSLGEMRIQLLVNIGYVLLYQPAYPLPVDIVEERLEQRAIVLRIDMNAHLIDPIEPETMPRE